MLDRRLEGRVVGGEVLEDGGPVVELDDLRRVLGPQRLDEPHGRGLGLRQLLVHGGRGVDQDRQRDGQVLVGEEGQLLADAVLEDREVLLREVGHVVVAAVGDRQVEVDDLDAHLEGRRALRGLGREGLGDEDKDGAYGSELHPAYRAPSGTSSGSGETRTFTPGRATFTSILRLFISGTVA